jgi:hypothetical protein
MSTITRTGLEFEFPALKEKLTEIDAKSKRLATIFEEAGDGIDLSKVKSVDGGKDAVLGAIRELNTELARLRGRPDRAGRRRRPRPAGSPAVQVLRRPVRREQGRQRPPRP